MCDSTVLEEIPRARPGSSHVTFNALFLVQYD
jgi:hypothetical protein